MNDDEDPGSNVGLFIKRALHVLFVVIGWILFCTSAGGIFAGLLCYLLFRPDPTDGPPGQMGFAIGMLFIVYVAGPILGFIFGIVSLVIMLPGMEWNDYDNDEWIGVCLGLLFGLGSCYLIWIVTNNDLFFVVPPFILPVCGFAGKKLFPAIVRSRRKPKKKPRLPRPIP